MAWVSRCSRACSPGDAGWWGAAGSRPHWGSEKRPEAASFLPQECKPCCFSLPRKERDPLQGCREERSGHRHCGGSQRSLLPPPSTRVPGISLRAGIALPKAAPWAPALLPAGVGEACPPGTRSDEEARGGLSAGRRGQGPLARARARLPGVGQGGGGPRRGLRRLSAKGIKGRRLAVPRWESVSPRPQPREGHGFGGLRALTPALRPRAHSGRTALVGRGLRRTGEVREQPGLPVAGHCHFLQGVQRIRG